MKAAREQDAQVYSGEAPGIVDFAPLRLRDSATQRDAAQMLLEKGVWGVPVVAGADRYIGMVTMRSIMGCALAVTLAGLSGNLRQTHADLRQSLVRNPRLRASLQRPVGHNLDLEVPAIRFSTALPQLLAVLCRRTPMVPIVADTEMRLVGVASLTRALRAFSDATF